ncbi:tetratricopeptide repeat protein [Edaphobacter sp. DSM 109919]|uniref:Tetratricopeptide repeat protein n=2 Tax=Edaphobacter paludis TaxID=3035702 RepID=A0AAU7CXA5_9BACT
MKTQRRARARYTQWVLCGLFATLLVLDGFGQAQKAIASVAPNLLVTVPNREGYVGSASCSRCHLGIYRQFSKTSMGRSMSRITPELLQTLHTSADLYDAKLDRHFEVHARDGKLYQSEYQTDAQGKEIFRNTQKLDWIIGAGANGLGALAERDHYLFQAPLSFYSKTGTWGPSPGYEFGDYGFNRPILAGCISCHSGRPRPVPETNGKFETPPFTQVAVGCENCHGPGAAHIHAMDSGDNSDNGSMIVNPADLSMDLANNICMSCHQTGNIRVFQEGKTYQDFRPGTPLDHVLSILMVPPDKASPPQADHLEHFYSMTLSKCYRSSGGRMGCITCHNPHVEPTQAEAPAYFNAKCMTCHTQQSCTLPNVARQRTTPADNCIGCHMPKRDVQVISHSSITNHRILARSDESFPESAFHQTTAALPDLIHLDPVPGSKEDVVPPLTLLQAYGELAATRPEYVAPYLKVLTQLEQTAPDSALVQAALGRRDLKSGKLPEAVDHLQRAVKLGSQQATVYGDLAEATTRLGQPEEGLALLQKATALDPFNPQLQRNLVARLIAMKQYTNALAAMEHYLEIFPQDSYIRKMLTLARGEPSP